MTISAFFVAKLLNDMIPATKFSWIFLRKELHDHIIGPITRHIVQAISIGGILFFLIGTFFKLFGKKFVFDHHDKGAHQPPFRLSSLANG